jgi:hypothetical protein
MNNAFFHRTNRSAAENILSDGFRDASGSYLTEQIHSGVWLSDVPLDDNEGADGDALLLVVMPLSEGEADQFEWVQEPSFGYREWLFPSKLINDRSTVLDVTEFQYEDDFSERIAELCQKYQDR